MSLPEPPAPPAARRAFWGLLALVALVWLAPLGSRSLIAPDEGRYASLAWQMFASGDWVTPRLNGFLYFEKPPLTYWLGALAFHLFGLNEFAARLWPGLAGLGCVAAAAWAARAWWGDEGALLALACSAAMSWLVANSHFLNVDTGLAFGLALAMAGVLVAQAPGAGAVRRRRAMLVAWAGMALATLAKGLIGLVIPGGAIVFYTLWLLASRQSPAARVLWRDLEWLRGLALFALVTVPWFVAVSLRNPGFAEFFFIHEHWLRYTTPASHREGAWWYFVPWVLLGAWPWTTLLAAAAWRTLRRRDGVPPAIAGAFRPRAFLVAWCLFIFLFFSASSSKLPSYVLPMFPALGVLAAAALRGRSAASLRPHLLVALGLWLALLLLWPLAGRFASEDTPAWKIHALLQWLTGAALLFAAAVALAWRLLARGRLGAAVIVLSVANLVSTLVAMQGHDTFGQLKSTDRIAPLIAAAVPPGAPVFTVQLVEQTLPFYLRRNVTLVDYVDEFDFGQRAEPQRALPTLDAFVARWRALPDGAAVMRPALFEQLRAQGLPMREIFRDPRRVVVARR